MNLEDESLSGELELALAYTPTQLRDRFRAALALDQRLGRIAAATSEPMLGQMRLAWWRDMMETEIASRPKGDAVLDAIGSEWSGAETPLVKMVDGWELVIASEKLGKAELEAIAAGRSAPMIAALGEECGVAQKNVELAARTYAFADLASRLTDPHERQYAVRLGLDASTNLQRLPTAARGLAVLGALARRALRRGGASLMEGRAASLVALKAAILRH